MAPIVLMKMGGSISISNFFEENVVDNLVNFLGIDRSLVTSSEIRRENSRRSTGDTENADITFKFGKDPVTVLHPIDPESATSTEPDPEDQQTFKEVTSGPKAMSEAFVEGTFELPGVQPNTLTAEAVPVEPPVGSGIEITEDTVQETSGEVPISVRRQQEEQAKLIEITNTKTLVVPKYFETDEDIVNELELKEMVPFPSNIVLNMLDLDGNFIASAGIAPDFWEATVSLIGGSPAASLLGVTTKAFKSDGYVTFDDLSIDTAGSGYQLMFTISSPSNTPAEPYVLPIPQVQPRPISIRFTQMSPLEKVNTTFANSIIVSLWDDALDQKVDASHIPPVGVVCELTLLSSNSLKGTTVVTINNAGDAVFDDLSIGEVGLNHKWSAFCKLTDESASYDTIISNLFIVHEYPEQLHLKKISWGLKFKGSPKYVKPSIDSFNQVLVEGKEITVEEVPDDTNPGFSIDKDAWTANEGAHPECYKGYTCLRVDL